MHILWFIFYCMRVFKELISLQPKLNPATSTFPKQHWLDVYFTSFKICGAKFKSSILQLHIVTMRIYVCASKWFWPSALCQFRMCQKLLKILDGYTENLTPLINYWEDSYIGRQGRGRRLLLEILFLNLSCALLSRRANVGSPFKSYLQRKKMDF